MTPQSGATGDRIARIALLLRSRNGARPYPSGPAGQILPDGVVFSRRIWPEVLLQQQRPVKSCLGQFGTAFAAAGRFSRHHFRDRRFTGRSHSRTSARGWINVRVARLYAQSGESGGGTTSHHRRQYGQVDYFRYKPTMRTERRRGKHNAYFVPYLSRLSTGQRMRT